MDIDLKLDKSRQYRISDHLYGIFLEDIGFAVDGGLNANMVSNYSFDGVYLDNQNQSRIYDGLRYWEYDCAKIEVKKDGGLSANSNYAELTVREQASLSNKGFNGLQKHSECCAMSIKEGNEYEFSCWIRNVSFDGRIQIRVLDESENLLTGTREIPATDINGDWSNIVIHVSGIADGYGKLNILFLGDGALHMDCISLMNTDTWHKDDPKWKHGRLRKDLVEILDALHPAFMRFPGGCIVEGMRKTNEYNWKNTVGNLWDRKSDYCLWSEKIPDGGYNQSCQIGFYEYFCLCEDLHMKPLPTLSAGINCQIRKMTYRFDEEPQPVDSDYFQKEIVQNYLDLIEFANGDPKDGPWARLRADMGHPTPFGLEMIGIGNENYGKAYRERFTIIRNAIKEKYPDIKCIISAGYLPQKPFLIPTWNYVYCKHPDVIVDEHSYHSPKWFEKQINRYRYYRRRSAKVYVGEYSANGMMAGKKMTADNSNCFDSALGEAAFLTGVERNGDVVDMASFAPLFNLIDSDQWFSNLIDFSPKSVCPSVNYYTQRLFMNYRGNISIAFKANLPSHVYVTITRDQENIYAKVVNTGNRTHTLLLCDAWLKGKKAFGEQIQGDPSEKNRISFDGTIQMNIMLEKQDWGIDGGSLKVRSQSIQSQLLKSADKTAFSSENIKNGMNTFSIAKS